MLLMLSELSKFAFCAVVDYFYFGMYSKRSVVFVLEQLSPEVPITVETKNLLAVSSGHSVYVKMV